MTATESATVERAIERVVREDRARLIATLVRRVGFDLAEECFDAAVEQALAQWRRDGVAREPAAWLLAVASRRAVDRLRHNAVTRRAHETLRVIEAASVDAVELDHEVPDDRLRLIFTCCHPAIARDAQVALALRWLSGLSTEDVARAFCVEVATMAQRLTRAKAKIEAARIPYEIPARGELAERVSVVLEVVYAIFNEGYVATSGAQLQRGDLADEAIYLGEMLTRLMPQHADTHALLALMRAIHARRRARSPDGATMLALDEQDRSQWNHQEIALAQSLLARALSLGPPSAYAIEAAIQALHDESPSYAQTDFAQIATLYGLLEARVDSPIVALNHIVARSMVDGPAGALRALLALERRGSLDGHPALWAAKAELLRRLERNREARAAYDKAIAATRNESERVFLRRKRDALSG
jgi:RNA polymerase sigma-70 factor (ECF subfamily)